MNEEREFFKKNIFFWEKNSPVQSADKPSMSTGTWNILREKKSTISYQVFFFVSRFSLSLSPFECNKGLEPEEPGIILDARQTPNQRVIGVGDVDF